MNPCRNDNSKTLHRGTKSHVSVSDEKFKPIEIAFIFSICIYDLPQKYILLTSDIHIFEIVTILKV